MNKDMINKRALAKAIDPDAKTIEGYASTFQFDRDQERFVRGAWDLSSYLKNPVVLWSHDLSQPPIARNAGITEDETGLKTITQFDPDNARSMEYFQLYQKGFLNAFSVGFIRKNYQIVDRGDGSGEKGLEITEAELFEYSAVSVPANPGALVTREVADLAIKMIGKNSIKEIHVKGMESEPLLLVVPEDKREKMIEAPADDFEPALKNLIELARIAKGSAMNETKRSLVMTAIGVFNEMLDTGEKSLTQEDLINLGLAMSEFGKVAAGLYPEAAPHIMKTISQVGKALEGHAD